MELESEVELDIDEPSTRRERKLMRRWGRRKLWRRDNAWRRKNIQEMVDDKLLLPKKPKEWQFHSERLQQGEAISKCVTIQALVDLINAYASDPLVFAMDSRGTLLQYAVRSDTYQVAHIGSIAISRLENKYTLPSLYDYEDCKSLITCTKAREIRVWNRETLEYKYTVKGSHSGSVLYSHQVNNLLYLKHGQVLKDNVNTIDLKDGSISKTCLSEKDFPQWNVIHLQGGLIFTLHPNPESDWYHARFKMSDDEPWRNLRGITAQGYNAYSHIVPGPPDCVLIADIAIVHYRDRRQDLYQAGISLFNARTGDVISKTIRPEISDQRLHSIKYIPFLHAVVSGFNGTLAVFQLPGLQMVSVQRVLPRWSGFEALA